MKLGLFNTNKNIKPLRTIEREIEMTRERYNNYLKTTSDNFMAQKGDVKIKNPHSMVNDSYWVLRSNIDELNRSAKKNNKQVKFEDARVVAKNIKSEPAKLDELGNSILISVKDKTNDFKQEKIINILKDKDIPLMKQISNALGEMFTGKKGANIDSDLGLK